MGCRFCKAEISNEELREYTILQNKSTHTKILQYHLIFLFILRKPILLFYVREQEHAEQEHPEQPDYDEQRRAYEKVDASIKEIKVL